MWTLMELSNRDRFPSANCRPRRFISSNQIAVSRPMTRTRPENTKRSISLSLSICALSPFSVAQHAPPLACPGHRRHPQTCRPLAKLRTLTDSLAEAPSRSLQSRIIANPSCEPAGGRRRGRRGPASPPADPFRRFTGCARRCSTTGNKRVGGRACPSRPPAACKVAAACCYDGVPT
jgi:hypothetical protein